MKHVFLLAVVLLALFACKDEPNCVDCINGGVCVDITQNSFQEYVAINFVDKDDNFDADLSKPGSINEAIRVYCPGENFPTEKMFDKEGGLVYKLGLSYEFD